MKWNKVGRLSMALVASAALALGMTACGGGTIGFMWVLGTTTTSTSAGQIVGFKIDDYTGNLTASPKSPFASGGANPVAITVKPGGRFVYVVNRGSGTAGAHDGNIAAFSVGGDGTLVFQESYVSQGQTPVWLTTDGSGNFLYVLDSVNPAVPGSQYYGLGDITVYSIAADTGRLSLVTNQSVKDANNINLNYFPVGLNPTMVKVSAGGCVYTLDSGDQTIFPYTTGSGGQLNLTTNSTIVTGAGNLTSVNLGGSYIYLTDAAVSTSHPNGQILPFTVGTNCALNSIAGGAVANLAPAEMPVWTLTEARQSKYLYVANQSSANSTVANSSISAFTITPGTGALQPAASGVNNPFPVGSGPVCLVEDPTNQYIYSSNSGDGSVTGFFINQGDGSLQPLQHGSTFKALTHATCLAISGSVG